MDNNRDYEFVLQTKVGYVQQFYWICYSVGTVYAFIVYVSYSLSQKIYGCAYAKSIVSQSEFLPLYRATIFSIRFQHG